MIRRTAFALAGLASMLLLHAVAYSANDPVHESLRKLKERLKAAQKQNTAPPVGTARRPVQPRPVRRYPRASRSQRATSGTRTRPGYLPTLKLKSDVDYSSNRVAGTIPKTGDIQVETINKGRVVYVYFKLLQRSGPDGRAVIPDVAPGSYEIMLKGPTLKIPWRRFVEVKPDQVTVVKVSL